MTFPDFILYAFAFFALGLTVGMTFMAAYACRRFNAVAKSIAEPQPEESRCR